MSAARRERDSPDRRTQALDSADQRASKFARKEPIVAATNINRVVLTGNLTRDPELRSTASGMSVCSLRIAVQHPPQEPVDRRVGGQAQLLRRHGLGRPGRELRALPLQGPPGRARRAPRVARVGDAGGPQAPGGRDHRRRRAVPRRPRRRPRRRRRRLHARAPTSRSTTATSSPPARRRRRNGGGGTAARRPTTTSRSRPTRDRPARRTPLLGRGLAEPRSLATLSGRRHR